MEKIAIVGFGCAGYSALRGLREAGSGAEVHVFSNTGEPTMNPMLTTYYVGGKIPRASLFPFGSLEEIGRAYDAVIYRDTEVAGLSAPERRLTFSDGSSEAYSQILLATGASAIVPPLGVTPGGRVLCMRTAADADLLKERLDAWNIRSALIVGASMVGIKVAEVFTGRGIPCVMADMAASIFPLAAFPDVAAEIQRRIGEKGVELRFGKGVVRALEGEAGVETFFSDGGAVAADLLLLCIGTRAETKLARDAGLAVNRGIVTDSRMMTSAPNIYAAGDCCENMNLLSGASQIIGLWSNAGWQGYAAGRCMAGADTRFSGNITHNITHFMGMDFVSLGDVGARGRRHVIGSLRGPRYIEAVTGEDGEIRCVNFLDSFLISGVIKNYMLNRLSGNRSPLPPELRGLLAREAYSDAFIRLFEGGIGT